MKAMTKPLNKNWQRQVENHLDLLKDIREESENDPARRQTYEGICHAFHHYLETYFGSAQGFADYLRTDIEERRLAASVPSALTDNDKDWKISEATVPLMIERASSLYEKTYKPLTEGISHYKAFHHAITPAFTLQ